MHFALDAESTYGWSVVKTAAPFSDEQLQVAIVCEITVVYEIVTCLYS